MLVVCYGMVKSASTFTYQVVNDLIHMDCNKKALDFVKINDVYCELENDFVSDSVDLNKLFNALDAAPYDFWGEHHILLKTHRPVDDFEKNVKENRKIKSVLSFRHPAEIALSLVDVANKELEEGKDRFIQFNSLDRALEALPYQVKSFLGWFDSDGVQSVAVSYDDIAREPHCAIRAVAEFLAMSEGVIPIVDNYVTGSKKIFELNKGIYGRRFKELSESQLEMIEEKYPRLCMLFN